MPRWGEQTKALQAVEDAECVAQREGKPVANLAVVRAYEIEMRTGDPAGPEPRVRFPGLWCGPLTAWESGSVAVSRLQRDLHAGAYERVALTGAQIVEDYRAAHVVANRASATTGVALIVRGQIVAGMRLIERALLSLERRGFDELDQLDALNHIFMGIYLSSRLRTAWRMDIDDIDGSAPLQVALALVEIRTGADEQAVVRLRAVLPDLYDRDPLGLAELAAASLRKALLLSGRPGEAAAVAPAAAVAAPAAILGYEARRMLLAGSAPRETAAAAELIALGDEVAAEAPVLAARSYIAAALGGSRSALGGLARVRPHIDSDLGELIGCMLDGMHSRTARGCLRAAEVAMSIGESALGGDLAGVASSIARAGGELVLLRRAKRLASHAHRRGSRRPGRALVSIMLNDVETRVAYAAAEGLSNAQIGKRSHLSPRTVEWYLGRIYRTLRLEGREDLVQLLGYGDR